MAEENPHDALFKYTFRHVEHAEGELRAMLPPALVARLKLETLRLVPGEFVDEHLSDRRSDILYAVDTQGGGEVLVHIVFEHQSTVDRWMAFRLLRYMVRIWDAHLREHPEASGLPLIVPLVLYHGPRGWSASRRFVDLMAMDGLAAEGATTGESAAEAVRSFVPGFAFLVDDLSAESDESLRRRSMTAVARLALWCLRHGRESERDLAPALERWSDVLLEVVRAPHGLEAMRTVMRHILIVSGPRPPDFFRGLFASLGPDTEEAFMNMAEYLRNEGRQEGLLEGKRQFLCRQLEARFGPLDATTQARIEAACPDDLERWGEQLLTAASLADALR
jgi:predicted transposase YdaD